MPAVSALAEADLDAALPALAALLRDCVAAGAAVSFVQPFPLAEAEAFWRRKVRPGVAAGTTLLLVAREGERIAGSVQLDCDTPPNQPHRGEVRKLLVHPDFRRRGLARLLMTELERRAAARGRTLLTLDTRTGDKAEPLYAGLGYVTVGPIPAYSLDPGGSGRLEATTIMYKQLA
jgi:ribosomal protein S18 acetylase RimI-like enzyme